VLVAADTEVRHGVTWKGGKREERGTDISDLCTTKVRRFDDSDDGTSGTKKVLPRLAFTSAHVVRLLVVVYSFD